MNSLISLPANYLITAGAVVVALASGLFYSSFAMADITADERSRLRKVSVDSALNALFAFVIVWKLSPLLFSFDTVRQAPIALLYLPGGPEGSILGIAAAIVHFMYSKRTVYRGRTTESITFRRSITIMTISAAIVLLGGNFLLSAPLADANSTTIDFELDSLDGGRYSLSEFKGRPVILNFWATWCPPCRAEYPELLKLQEELGDSATIIGVNLTRSEPSLQAVRDFTSGYDAELLHLLDRDGSIQDKYGIRVVPTTFILDTEGKIIHHRVGAVSAAVLRNLLP